ncbi:pectinesterase family protein [Isoptericola sp. F-RaC21]|uniref:pectinesterase family protein n=1 Tax=Isoptericola sp. F-RaC21 TaxID=3141452 RepID=UPI00315C3DFB
MTRTTRRGARRRRLGATVAAALTVVATGAAGATGATAAAESTVAADGTGDFTTIQEAVDAVPADNASEHVITIEPGTYRERVLVDKPNVALVGAGSAEDVVIVEGVSAGEGGSHRDSATVHVTGEGFRADNVTFENDHDESASEEGNQALALYLEADRAVIDDSRVIGDQDTFMIDDPTRAYVSDSYIEGTVDFIYGEGTAVFHRCDIYEKRQQGGPITAARTAAGTKYGLLFYRSHVTGATDGTTQLGRPWGPDGQVLFRESELSATIDTDQPWIDMSGNDWREARFLEYRNTGAGATVNGNRAQLPDDQADEYTPEKYLAGSDGWDPVDRSGESAGGTTAAG